MRSVTTPMVAAGLALSCSYWATLTGDSWHGAVEPLTALVAEMELLVGAAYTLGAADTSIRRLPVCRWPLSRLVIDCITAERFAAEFHGREPLIISGVVSEAALRSWSLDAVIAEHGSSLLAMTIGGALPVMNEGGGTAAHIALSSARTRMLADPRLVVFDTSSTPAAMQIASRVDTPAVIDTALSGGADLRAVDDQAIWRPFLSVMAPGLGLPTHRHGETWSVLLSGRKRWFTAPPGWSGTPLQPPFLNTSAWLAHVLRGPLPRTAVQHPGDVLYLPTDTAHATFNLRESLLIGRQRQHGGGTGNEHELDALETACFPNRPASLVDGQGDPNACVVQGHRHAQPVLAAPDGPARDASLGVGSFFYLKGFNLQPLDVRAAAGYMACARADDGPAPSAAPLRPGQRPGAAQRARMLRDASRALRGAESRWREWRGSSGRHDEVAPLLAAAYTKLAQAASAPSESETRRELRGRAAALVDADDPTVRELAIGAG